MRLTDLQPALIRHNPDTQGWRRVTSITEASGVMFLCPKCIGVNGGPAGTHQVVCWSRSRGAPDAMRPGPGRWSLQGTGLDDLSLMAEAPSTSRSVALTGGCMWHGYVTSGEVTDA